jgi:Transposase DDE domain group 1
VRQAEEKIKVCHGIADCLGDNRQEGKVRHSKVRLILQRVLQIVAGYEDVNDSNYLRHEPLFKILCSPPEEKQEDFQVLAIQPTMSPWENQITNQENKKLRKYFVEHFLAQYTQDSSQIILDIDEWNSPTYGHQQLSLFHGYYGNKMYFPVLINEANTGYPLIMQLRAGNSHSGKGIAGILRWLLWRLKKAIQKVEIIVRGDAGFSLPEIIKVGQRSQVKYAFGFGSNAVLKRKIENLLEIARVVYHLTGEKARLFDDVYYASQSWSEPRRIIMKAEWLEKGANPRFLVTNLEENAAEVYDNFYVQRGESSEGRIKELKLGIKADRLSCHQFMVNQFRLFLYHFSKSVSYLVKVQFLQ